MTIRSNGSNLKIDTATNLRKIVWIGSDRVVGSESKPPNFPLVVHVNFQKLVVLLQGTHSHPMLNYENSTPHLVD